MRNFNLEPAALIAGLNAVIALAVAFGLPLSADQSNAVIVVATGLLGLWIAVVTRPIVPAAVATTVGTILTALGAFNLNWSEEKIGTVVAATSVILGLAIRVNVTPVAKARA